MTKERTRSAVEKLQRLTQAMEAGETTDEDVAQSWPLVYAGFLFSIADSLDVIIDRLAELKAGEAP